MGTITIVELTAVGGPGAVDGSPVANLSTVLTTTVDSSTSTSPESITLDPATRYVRVSAVEDHRVSVNDSLVTTIYDTVSAGGKEDFAINKDDRTLYYRADA